MFAGSFCKWKGFRRLCSCLPSPGHSYLLGALAHAALPADQWGRTSTGWTLQQGRGGGCDMDAVLKRHRGWWGLICSELPICQWQAGSWHGDRHLHLFCCCCAPLQCFWEVKEQCWDTSASLLPLVFWLLAHAGSLSRHLSVPELFSTSAVFIKPLLQLTPITCFWILPPSPKTSSALRCVLLHAGASCQQPISLPHRSCSFLFPTCLQCLICLLLG